MEMELGPVFAILTAACFGAVQVLIRRSTYQSEESFTPVAVSLLVGTPLFIIIVSVSGEWEYLWSFSGQQYALLCAAGLVHFIFARYLFFNSTRIIGANPTVAITRTSVIFAVILGVVFLGESVTTQLIFGALLIMFGAVLSSVEISRSTFKISTQGLLLGLGTALCVAGSAALIRPVMATTDAVFAATFVSYLTAFVIILIVLLLRREQRSQVMQLSRPNLMILIPSAVLLVIGHLFRFSALLHSPVSVAQPLMGTIVIFVLLLSWIFNRRIDVFNWRVVMGIVLVLAGVFLVYG